MKLLVVVLFLLSATAMAGVLPASRGGTGANLTPVLGQFLFSTSSGFSLSSAMTIVSGSSIVLASNSTLGTSGTQAFMISQGKTLTSPQASDGGTIETDGTHLYWINSSGTRKTLDN